MSPENNKNLNFSIVPAEPDHLPDLVNCHISAFPGEFLSLLGPTFLRDFYRFYINTPDGIALVALAQPPLTGTYQR